MHIACTRLTVNVIDDLLRDLRTAVDEVKKANESGKGGMVTMCAFTVFFMRILSCGHCQVETLD